MGASVQTPHAEVKTKRFLTRNYACPQTMLPILTRAIENIYNDVLFFRSRETGQLKAD